MGAQGWAAVGVIVSIVAYIVVSLRAGKNISGPESFYNDTGRLRRATLSLACYNVTLGTGIAYLVDQSTLSGYSVFLTPFAMALGYWLFAKYMGSLDFHPTAETPNLYRLLSPRSDGISLLTRIYSIAIVVTFALVLGFELWLGSDLVAAAMFANPTLAIKVTVAGLLFLIVAIYTTIGGMRGSVETDFLQAFMLLGFIVAAAVLAHATQLPEDDALEVRDVSQFQGILVTVLAIVTALTTQFYSIVNNNFGLRYNAEEQRKMFTWAGALAAAFYIVVLLIFMTAPTPFTLNKLASMVGTNSISTFSWLAIFLAGGMVAMSMSSLDNATVSVSKIVFENWLTKSQPHNIPRLRLIHFLVSVIMMGVAVMLIVLQLNLFYTILTILFAASVFSPILSASIWLHCKGRVSSLDNKAVVISIAGLTLSSWGIYAYFNVNGQNMEGSILHLVAVVCSGVFALVDVKRNGKAVRQEVV